MRTVFIVLPDFLCSDHAVEVMRTVRMISRANRIIIGSRNAIRSRAGRIAIRAVRPGIQIALDDEMESGFRQYRVAGFKDPVAGVRRIFHDRLADGPDGRRHCFGW